MSHPFHFRLSNTSSACFNSKKTTAKFGVRSVNSLLCCLTPRCSFKSRFRSLLPYAGRSPKGILRLSTSALFVTQSKGLSPFPTHLQCVMCVVQEDPKLWYGIGILYDRYGSLDHAEEAFASVLKMDKGWSLLPFSLALLCTHFAELDFDKANEILFRLGIIYKQQGKYDESLSCFDRILRNPPSPLAHADIWFQIGHVYEQQKDVSSDFPRLWACDGH